jgi:hypothetical protein
MNPMDDKLLVSFLFLSRFQVGRSSFSFKLIQDENLAHCYKF